jgi:uncharacterized protein (TIGR02246 family)
MSDHSEPASSSTDARAIEMTYREVMDAWNRGSGDASAACFADEGDLVGFDGTHMHGRGEIGPFHQQLFDTWLRGSRLVGKVRRIRFLQPDVAIMHVVGGTVMAGQSDLDPERNSVQSLVVARHDDDWRIEAFQNTRAQYIGRREAVDELTQELRQLL